MFGFFKKNDWTPVWTDKSKWKIFHEGIRRSDGTIFFPDWYEYVTSIYEILYSPSRNEYKLKLDGYKPKESEKYKLAIQKLNEFQNEKK